MAVESRYLNMNNPYNNNNNCYVYPPLSGTTSESFVPVVYDNIPAKADSGLTYVNQANTRKRSRPSIVNPMVSYINGGDHRCGSVMFLGEDLSVQIQQQQLEMDRFIAHHTEKVRMEIEERRKSYSRRIIASIEESIKKRLKAKDDEIENIAKINWALQEKIKSLSIEGQIWRDLAHTNEATAHTLRTNLEQALAAQQFRRDDDVAAIGDDAESCCGSNEREGEEGWSRGGESKAGGMCRHCGVAEPSVLMLPCRHLCLCTVCGSSVHTCPVCNTPKNASVQVIM